MLSPPSGLQVSGSVNLHHSGRPRIDLHYTLFFAEIIVIADPVIQSHDSGPSAVRASSVAMHGGNAGLFLPSLTGLVSFSRVTQGLRPGLNYAAAPRLHFW